MRSGTARRLVWAALVLAVVPFLVRGEPAGAAPALPGSMPGVIRGRVVDRTPPVHPLAGQPVRLRIVERGASSERETRTDATGAFVFAGLPVGGARVFVPVTEWQGVTYGEAARLVLTDEAPVRDAPLVVYDAGAGPRVLRGALLFAVVDVAPGALRVTTVQRIENPADRTVVTTAEDPLVFPLPRGVAGVQALDGWRNPHVEDGRITDAPPIPPGVAQFTYAYLEGAGRDAQVTWTPPFGAARVEVLIGDPGARVEADGLHAAEAVTVSGRRYARWSGGPLPAGGAVAVRLAGLPGGGARWPALLAGALAAALAAALVSALRHTRSASDRHASV